MTAKRKPPKIGARKTRATTTSPRSRSERNAKAGPQAVRDPAPTPTTADNQPVVEAHEVPIVVPAARGFPIVGIGASAGGLEALERFLVHVPDNSGMGFVVIQHLDPTHKGAMVELLQRASKMPVVEVTDRLTVEPDHVYVIPPGKDISILHGILHLLPMTSPRGLNLPIDYFFRSLAEDRQDDSIGVVLSGMGSDGTLGLRAIKEKAGATFVQSLSSAKFDGMPRSAIDAGLADIVASAEELPARIVAYHKHTPHVPAPEPATRQQSALEKVLILLRNQCGNDFSLYKRSTVERRIERRMGLHQIAKLDEYVRYLRDNPHEIDLLFQELLIGVTSFFRDPEAWEQLRDQILPQLTGSRTSGVLRAWVPACSTGEEAYSLAMVLSEVIQDAKPPLELGFQIFGTDLDKDAIEKARQGVYPANIAADVTPERLRRFFREDERGYRVCKEIREAVVFAPQNIITDPPFTKLDILSCRNLLIYLSAELQRKLIPLFHYSLNPGGVLFLGSAESVGGFTQLFSPLDGRSRLYRRLETTISTPAVEFPSAFTYLGATPVTRAGETVEAVRPASPSLQQLTDRVIVQRFSPATVLTNERGDILYLSARTGKYLEPVVGKANLNLFAMAREGLRYELSSAFAAALKSERPIVSRGLQVRTNGSSQTVDVTVLRLAEPEELRGTVMTVIADVASTTSPVVEKAKPGRAPASRQLAALERELEDARDEAQTLREEMQTSQEELKSTNEELQSTNEELQSTNEELTTSKEEMQSMNEELQTVNHELQSKVDDLARSNNDMRNLLNSTEVATLFLDGELLVRRFTTQTARIIKLIPSDMGRPITDINTDLDYPTLADDAREVIRTLVFKETEVGSRNGRWYNVRILPYRTLDNVIDGVVITFTDVTSAKRLEASLRDQANQLRQMASSPLNIVWECDPDGACTFLGPQWVAYTGRAESGQHGYGWLEQVHPDDRERFRTQWRAAIAEAIPFDTEIRISDKHGTFRWFTTRLVPIRDKQGTVVKWYGTHIDVDDLKRAKRQGADRLARLREWIAEPALAVDDELVISSANASAAQLVGRPIAALVAQPVSEILPNATLTEKLREAFRDQHDLAFDVRLEGGPRAGSYHVVVLPDEDGATVLLRAVDAVGGGSAP